MDSRFSRCPYFLIVDSKSEKFEVIENTSGQAFQGAGFSAAKMLVDKGVKVIIAGDFGHNAKNVLSQGGVETFQISEGTAAEALKDYKGQR